MGTEFVGKVVLVTGAASGIGRASAQAFAREGAVVVVADIDQDGAQATVDDLVASGADATFVRCDVSRPDDVSALIGTIVDRFGRLDVAHNNAGIEGDLVPMADVSLENWNKVFAVNVTGVFLCMQAEIRAMLAAGGGAIVNTASVSGLLGGWTLSTYTAAKHAVVGLTRAAACDYGEHGIRINAVCPAAIDTPFIAELPEALRQQLAMGHPIGRLGRPEEIADAVVWLASPRASFMLGHALPVDGGVMMGAIATRPVGPLA
jgi:NAD(P)-dependent dehydrogenase (short-subunit alcohol dehydrogenase family)